MLLIRPDYPRSGHGSVLDSILAGDCPQTWFDYSTASCGIVDRLLAHTCQDKPVPEEVPLRRHHSRTSMGRVLDKVGTVNVLSKREWQ